MKFGCHTSIREGYLGAAMQAFRMNAAAFQYFPKNPKSLAVKNFSHEDAMQCKAFCEEKSLMSVSHSPYPTSLTPQNKKKRELVIRSLLNDLDIAEACGSIGVVVHFGKQISHTDPIASYQLVIDMLNEILQRWDGNAKLLLENNAGLPGAIGTTLEELVQIRKLCTYHEKIGFCFDTCHAFSCGLWDGDNWDSVLSKGMELDYFGALKLIHFNNSKYETRVGKDRHAPIFGPGYITEDQFDQLVQTPQLANIPFILETPKEEMPHQKEIELLQKKWGNASGW
ncbi:deoxyribonuclease IV [Lederbergia lenta]|uniref:Apurinic endonuclease Apn1 n=1 Tax=Lederbergia lenta TaxID=1467 RepID=A0A2X4WJ93_LEDLE|nr:deoxyribonuclease IV [Lederbergia lenta]MCM3109439.1 deoxyribonuclease IV [Lederbergia lenta]MEC2324796.1 deoxyribonuclease IV [Lederbergia lenta]SQI57640.1 apurinic endonuclease Apn1 [Lederbergia lenta]